MKINKKFELESTFIEIINPRKSNIIVGVIYKHPKMDVTDFNNNLNNLLKKINQEQKAIQEPLLTILSVMSSQKTLFVLILQLPFLTIYPSFWSHRTLLLIHPPINLMFLKKTGQNLTRKILSWITLIQIGSIF